MSDFVSVSHKDLRRKRQQLRRDRRFKWLRSIWQWLAVLSCTGAIAWTATLPGWIVRRPEQIEIEGDRYLTEAAIRERLPLAYPQSLLQINPEAIERALREHDLVADARVNRQLFPPALIVTIEERRPVAIAYKPANLPPNDERPGIVAGLIDAAGTWIPWEEPVNSNNMIPLPELQVVGEMQMYRSRWAEMYRSVRRSPVRVHRIDWRDPGNLILETELGTVRVGAYTPRFPEQLRVLDRLRNYADRVNPKDIAYIDLKQPETPAFQMRPTAKMR